MLSAFKYRIYPKDEQEMRLNRSLLSLCDLYNGLKAEEMRRYREEHRSTSHTKFRALDLDACGTVPKIRNIFVVGLGKLGLCIAAVVLTFVPFLS